MNAFDPFTTNCGSWRDKLRTQQFMLTSWILLGDYCKVVFFRGNQQKTGCGAGWGVGRVQHSPPPPTPPHIHTKLVCSTYAGGLCSKIMRRRLWIGLLIMYSMLIIYQTPTIFYTVGVCTNLSCLLPSISDNGTVSRDSSLGVHFLLYIKQQHLSYHPPPRNAAFRIEH